jgi:hypothetical protein
MRKYGMIITAYCDTKEKQDRLYKICTQVRPACDFLVVSSHTPIEAKVQEYCNYAIYDQRNVADHRKYSHGVAECMLVEQAMHALQYYGIEETYKIPFDCDIGDVSIFRDWSSQGRPMASCKWGNFPFGTFAYYTQVKWFMDTFRFYHDIDEMFKVSNLLEVAWWKDVVDKGREGDVFLYPDLRADMFRVGEGFNRVDLSFKTYQE